MDSRDICFNENVTVCIDILKDIYNPDRDLAIAVLGKMKDKRAVEPLIQALKDDDAIIRGDVATALGDIGDERAVEPLIQASMEKDSDVKSAAEYALKNFGIGKIIVPSYTQISKNNSTSYEAMIYVNTS